MVSPLSIVGTFLLTAAFFAVTLHVAVRWVLGGDSFRKALLVGPAPAAAVVALQSANLPTAVVPVGAIVADLFVITAVYDLEPRWTAALAVAHVVITVALAFALANLWLALVG